MTNEERRLFADLMKSIKVSVNEEFITNFERKAFFDKQWKSAKINNIGSLLNRTGELRQSLKAEINGSEINWESALAYANIHNKGGTIKITQKMRGFFWYKFRMVSGGNNKNLSKDALIWRSLALKPVGSVINIPKRQFIGDHPQVKRAIKSSVDYWMTHSVDGFIRGNLRNIFD